MMLVLFISQAIFLNVLQAIDRNEKVSLCLPGFNTTTSSYIHDNEGVWFPQYRTRYPENDEFKCHTLYEKMSYADDKYTLEVNAYYTKGGEVLKDGYLQSYEQERRGLLVDEEYYPDEGPYRIYNFIIQLTPQYRIRYVCTDLKLAKTGNPTVYIETRQTNPVKSVINQALTSIKKAGLQVTLERIVQKNCVRPLNDKGYPTEEEN